MPLHPDPSNFAGRIASVAMKPPLSPATVQVPPADRRRPDQAPLVEMRGATKEFRLGRNRSLQVLQDVNLAIRPGEFMALVGPSGCGKSTILRLMAGLDQPTQGQVTIGDASPRELIAQHRLGYAFQEHALLPWASVEQNIALPFKLAHRRVDRARIAYLIAMVGLSGFENARPKQLSGGMRQRVAIARALALAPEVLLLDEPFGALDEITRRRLNFELARIWEETGVTTVLVTHSVDEALLLADRVVVMVASPGRVARDIPVDVTRPRTEASLSETRFGELSAELIRLLDQQDEMGERRG